VIGESVLESIYSGLRGIVVVNSHGNVAGSVLHTRISMYTSTATTSPNNMNSTIISTPNTA
jgi:hypothetical protein